MHCERSSCGVRAGHSVCRNPRASNPWPSTYWHTLLHLFHRHPAGLPQSRAGAAAGPRQAGCSSSNSPGPAQHIMTPRPGHAPEARAHRQSRAARRRSPLPHVPQPDHAVKAAAGEKAPSRRPTLRGTAAWQVGRADRQPAQGQHLLAVPLKNLRPEWTVAGSTEGGVSRQRCAPCIWYIRLQCTSPSQAAQQAAAGDVWGVGGARLSQQ